MNFEDPAATPVDVALQDLTAVFAQLLEAVEAGGLDAYDNLQLVGFAQTFEQFGTGWP